jgi:ATP-dependent DNA ligase
LIETIDQRPQFPLLERKARLGKLIATAKTDWLHYSESFDDSLELLTAADRMRLERVVSKRRDAPYRSSATGLRCQTWRGANKVRSRLFERHSNEGML